MIKYALVCDKAHEFEGWFGSSAEFDKQCGKGLLECPVCGSVNVEKMLMAPRVSGTRKSTDNDLPVASMPAPSMPEIPKEVADRLRELKKHVQANAEDVGSKFPEEARKIHYGEAEARGIYGKASPDEAVSLLEEGVDVLPIPDLPEDQN